MPCKNKMEYGELIGIQKLRLTTTQAKEFGLNQLYYLRFDKPIILSHSIEESIRILREIFEPDYSEEKKKKYKDRRKEKEI